jgi:hypothetical protein
MIVSNTKMINAICRPWFSRAAMDEFLPIGHRWPAGNRPRSRVAIETF